MKQTGCFEKQTKLLSTNIQIYNTLNVFFRIKRLFCTLFLFSAFGLFQVFSQPLASVSHDYYSCPVKIPVFLAGNFAELRPNHFHAGIDIKTQGHTGVEVYAAADGYISRISISSIGYGHALYINHPNGTTTVYGHLERFAPAIEEYINKVRYEKESFSIDQIIDHQLFPVKKGELIAYSGNTGSSGGPHLHFEIRQTGENNLLNPLMFNMPVKDNLKPLIQALMVYPVSDNASVEGKTTGQRFEIVKTAKGYQLKTNKPINVFGNIGFGVQAFDRLDGSANRCGIFSIKLFADKKLIYFLLLDHFLVSDTKYVNSQMDYALALKTGQRLYRTWIEPGNKLNIYHSVEKQGIFEASDQKIHEIEYEIGDVYGNVSSLTFKIQSKEFKVMAASPKGKLMKYNKDNEIKDEGIRFYIPEGALYNNVDFIYAKKMASSKFYSPVYQLHDALTPLHVACTLKIKANKLPENLRDKVMLAQVDPATGRVYSATGKYDDGWVEGNIRFLGNYALVVDITPPKISAWPNDKKTPKDPNTLRFKVTDDLSGIDNFKGMIDGKWALFEYDLKNNMLSYTYDKSHIKFGQDHQLVLQVTDFKGNTSTFKTTFHK